MESSGDTILGELEDQVTCWICFEIFNDPITLHCSHSFCKDCVTKMYKKSPLCAFCRREFTLPLPDINQNLIKLVKTYRHKTSGAPDEPMDVDERPSTENQECLWLDAPDEILISIFTHLPPRDLAQINRVCRTFHFLADDGFLWREHCRARFPFVQISKYGNDWKRCFSSRFRMTTGWDSGKPGDFKMQPLRAHTNYVSTFDYYRNNVVSGSADQSIKIWSVTSAKPLHTIETAHTGGPVNTVKFNEIRIVSGGNDNLVKMWDTTSGSSINTLAHQAPVRCLQFNESTVISGSDDRSIKVWDVRSGTTTRTITGHNAGVFGVEYSGHKIHSIGNDAVIEWDVRTGNPIHSLHGGTPTCFQVLPEAINRVVVGESNGSLRVWNTSTGQQVSHFAGAGSRINGVASDGEKVVTGSSDNKLRLYDLRNNRHLQDLDDHKGPVHAVGFDGNKIVSAGGDHCLKVWDPRTGKRLYSLLGGTLQARGNDPEHPTLPGCSGMKFDEGRIVGAFKSLLRVYTFSGEDINQ